MNLWTTTSMDLHCTGTEWGKDAMCYAAQRCKHFEIGGDKKSKGAMY